jgi:hypothetical protein
VNRNSPPDVSRGGAEEKKIRVTARVKAWSRSFLALTAALTASGALLVVPPYDHKPDPFKPEVAELAWPQAQRGAISADLADGTTYQPVVFLGAHSSIGTAQTKDNRDLRLVLLGADQKVRELRRLPVKINPSFQDVTVDGSMLVWAEQTGSGQVRIWTMNLTGGRPAHELTTDTGNAVFYRSQYDLEIANGQVHWVATAAGGITEVRSVALTGGPVTVRREPGAWQLSAWPWLANGVSAAIGTTLLRNLQTNQDISVRTGSARSAANCSPKWCVVMSLARSGYSNIDVMHPDGAARERIAGGDAAPGIPDVAVLDRFLPLAAVGPTSALTGNSELLVFDLAARRTIEVSPDAAKISYRAGVLWWATGNLDAYVWHSLDLRTI